MTYAPPVAVFRRPEAFPRAKGSQDERKAEEAMSPVVLVMLVLVALLAKRLADLYLGGRYVCPSCGTRSAGRHLPECPWSRA
jgi:hypothetical protein